MMNSEQSLYLRRLRFPTDLEAAFHSWHYAGIRSTLRVVVAPVIAFVLFFAVRDFIMGKMPAYAVGVNGLVIALCLVLYALTFSARFEKVWQPVTVGIIWIGMTIMLNGPAVTGPHHIPEGSPPSLNRSIPSAFQPDGPSLSDHTSPPSGASRFPGGGAGDQMLSIQLYTIMIFLAAFRLRFLWATLLNSGLLISALWVLTTRLHVPAMNLSMFEERSLLVVFALMISALVQERLSRTAFLAHYLLDQERNDERRKREQTEGMLHVLGQAIGGIVHDLGNPLSAVQGGALLLEQIVDDEVSDKATLKDLTGIIIDGAQLLNYQRLSLMEQTRVLEGKPIPVERQATSLRRIIDAGVRYQQPKFARGRQVVIDSGDMTLCADEMKLISVFMNLIGNAMKYSDGAIHISWRLHAGKAVVAISDEGMRGKGISEIQAGRLFVAFGRLEANTRVEGTGLGLLSVRKIMEAHGGEVFIEGYVDGTSTSPIFSTAQCAYPSIYPSMLVEGARTAFVLVCPGGAIE